MARLLRTAVLAGIAYVLWQYLKTVLEEPPPQLAPAGPTPPAEEPPPPETPKSNPSPAGERSNNAGRSKAELYEEATRLGIKGRSKMSKAELERAIRDAG